MQSPQIWESLAPRLTYEEREALPGFAVAPPRQIQKKVDKTGSLWQWGCILPCLVLAMFLAGIAYILPILRVSIAIGSGVFLGLLGLLAVPGTIWEFRNFLESKWLTRYGKAAITNPARREIKVDCGSEGPYGFTEYTLHYDFLTDSGETVTGTYTSRDFVDEGTCVLVVYHPNKPKVHRLYHTLQHEPVLVEENTSQQRIR